MGIQLTDTVVAAGVKSIQTQSTPAPARSYEKATSFEVAFFVC